MPGANEQTPMYCSSNDLLPYRCPSCGSSKRFRSLIALRLHTSILHEMPTPVKPPHRDALVREKEESKEENDNKNEKPPVGNWERSLMPNASVDEMFNRYSMKMDQALENYDSQSRKLEKKLKLTKQLEEIRKQKQQLHKIKSNWQSVHGISQLVQDTDAVIKKRIGSNPHQSKPDNKVYKKSNQKEVTPPTTTQEAMNEPDPQLQVDLSVQLAAQYKALALDTEQKLKEKIDEEYHLKQYIDTTAHKEMEAKKKLADFMEGLLCRVEIAEAKLQVYQSQSGGLNFVDGSDNISNRRKSEKHPETNRKKVVRQKSNTTDSSRLSDSGIQVFGKQRKHGENKTTKNSLLQRPPRDPYVQEILEPPSSVEIPRKWPSLKPPKKQLDGIDTSRLIDASSLMPFSNVIKSDKDPDLVADRRVALFCVFTHLRSIDLLRSATVCREWREASQHPQLWSRIRFHNALVDSRLFKLISKWSSDTCCLSLKNIGLINDNCEAAGNLEEGLEMILKSCSENLLVVSIDQCDPVITSRALWLVSCYNKQIRSISYRSSIDPICHQVAWALGSSCRNIVSLEVAPLQPCSARGLFDNNVARLLSWCWPQLQALSFGGADIDGAGLLAVALNCHHLKVLEVDHARGITEENARSVCKHGFRELHTMLFTHTPVRARTLLCFLESLRLRSLHVIISQRDYFSKSKNNKIRSDYAKISRALVDLQQNPKYRKIVNVQCES